MTADTVGGTAITGGTGLFRMETTREHRYNRTASPAVVVAVTTTIRAVTKMMNQYYRTERV